MRLPNIGLVEMLLVLAIVAVVVAIIYTYVRGTNGGDAEPSPLPSDIGDATVVLRTRRSIRREAAIRWYQADLHVMVQAGYLPATQSWLPGQWAALEFLVALILMPFGIGFIVALYLIIARPPGTMLVTYVRRDAARPAAMLS